MACVVVPYAYVNELLNYPRTVKKFELVFVVTQKGEFVFLIMHITRLTPHSAGCDHEFCTRCALYLCSTNCTSTVAHGPPGSIACPLCRNGIVSFAMLPGTKPAVKEIARTSLSLAFCTCSGEAAAESAALTTPLCRPEVCCSRISPLGSSFRSVSCQRFPSMRFNSSLCMGAPDVSPSLIPCNVDRNLRNNLARCSRSGFRRTSHTDGRRSWFSVLNQYVATGSGC